MNTYHLLPFLPLLWYLSIGVIIVILFGDTSNWYQKIVSCLLWPVCIIAAIIIVRQRMRK